jgi:large subunit ribosomal protein L18
MNKLSKAASRAKRHTRLRHKVTGTAARPRLAVFRSNKFVYAQLIDDENGTTVASADSRTNTEGTRVEQASAVGANIAEKAKGLQIDSVVFDRGGFRYQGIVAALADAARSGGLQF